MSNTKEIRIVGFGGQGVVLHGHILGYAYAISRGHHATMIQSFGPEARGSACSATLIVSESEVLYPYVQSIDVMIAMSGEGYEKYKDQLKEDGVLIHERELVSPSPKPGQKVFSIPSTRIADEIGRRIVQNIVMVGFVAGASGLVSHDEMRDAVLHSVPAGTEKINLQAFDAGWKFYQEEYGGGATAGKAVAAEAAK